jgi:hypothetical protein
MRKCRRWYIPLKIIMAIIVLLLIVIIIIWATSGSSFDVPAAPVTHGSNDTEPITTKN